jgi:hypothetical protein
MIMSAMTLHTGAHRADGRFRVREASHRAASPRREAAYRWTLADEDERFARAAEVCSMPERPRPALRLRGPRWVRMPHRAPKVAQRPAQRLSDDTVRLPPVRITPRHVRPGFVRGDWVWGALLAGCLACGVSFGILGAAPSVVLPDMPSHYAQVVANG